MSRGITRAEAAAEIRVPGRSIVVEFTKADGSHRRMFCCFEERRPVRQHRERPDVITVFDEEASDYRSIPIDRLLSLSIDGKSMEISK